VLTFVNISPAVYNLGETICSLNFASRCRSTELGQAKKQTGMSASASVASLASLGGGGKGGADSDANSVSSEFSMSSSAKLSKGGPGNDSGSLLNSARRPLTSASSSANLTSPANVRR
jgi:hypothetical protein